VLVSPTRTNLYISRACFGAGGGGSRDERREKESERAHSLLPSHAPLLSLNETATDIEENGVRLRLNVVDTPGFGDFVNNDDS